MKAPPQAVLRTRPRVCQSEHWINSVLIAAKGRALGASFSLEERALISVAHTRARSGASIPLSLASRWEIRAAAPGERAPGIALASESSHARMLHTMRGLTVRRRAPMHELWGALFCSKKPHFAMSRYSISWHDSFLVVQGVTFPPIHGRRHQWARP